MMYYFHPLAYLERQRKKCLKSLFTEPLLTLIQQPIWPPSTLLHDIEFLVMDFETSGLDPINDDILSIGWVVIKKGQINLQSARRIYISSPEHIVPESAVINHIVPETLATGGSIGFAMQQLLMSMTGRVLIAHCVAIERKFFEQYCERTYGLTSIPVIWLDTLQIEKSLTQRLTSNTAGDYCLSTLRAEYGLPNYPAHDALIDAVATGELFLAQIKCVFGSDNPSLGPLFKRSRPHRDLAFRY